MRSFPAMRNHLTVQVADQPETDFLEYGPQWRDVCDVWGYVAPVSDRQRVQNALAERVVSHKITTRYDPRIPTTWETMRLLDQNTSRAFNVVGFVNVEERNEKLEFEASEARV